MNTQTSPSDEPSLLVWREWRVLVPSAVLALPDERCPYCRASLHSSADKERCRLCGWECEWIDSDEMDAGIVEDVHAVKERVLRGFKISSGQLALAELGSHLKTNFRDTYSLPPRRFEELIGDVFSNIGYAVEMTKQSRDGGVDLFLLSASGGRIGIVQCKRYLPNRKVDVSIVNELLGTQLAFDVGTAVLVTTSAYTRPAQDRARADGVRQHGFAVTLLDASDLLRLLQVYNVALPPLDKLDRTFLAARGVQL